MKKLTMAPPVVVPDKALIASVILPYHRRVQHPLASLTVYRWRYCSAKL